MPKRTLFHILSEQPWWVSLLIALGLFLAIGLFSTLMGAAAAFPFVLVAAWVGWQRLRHGPVLDPARFSPAVREASAEEVREMLSQAYARDGHEVSDSPEGDLLLVKQGYTTLVRYKRWRARNTGAAVVAELQSAMRKRNADRGVHVCAGTVAEAARAAADKAGVTLLDGPALAALVRRSPLARRIAAREPAAAKSRA